MFARLKKKWKQFVTKAKTHAKKASRFTSSLHIPLLFKNVFISLFSASYDILKTRLQTMQSRNPNEDLPALKKYFFSSV